MPPGISEGLSHCVGFIIMRLFELCVEAQFLNWLVNIVSSSGDHGMCRHVGDSVSR